LLRLLERNTTAPRRLLTRRRLVRHFANSAGTRPKFTRCRAIGYTGGRNGTCRIAVVVGNSHSHSLAHVGARLVALGWAEPTRTYATAHEWHLLFSGPDPLKERACSNPKPNMIGRPTSNRWTVSPARCARCWGWGSPKMAMSEPINRISRRQIRSMPNAPQPANRLARRRLCPASPPAARHLLFSSSRFLLTGR